MMLIPHEDLNEDGTGEATAIQALKEAKFIFISDTITDESIPTFGVTWATEPVTPEFSGVIKLDTSSEKDVIRVLNCIIAIKGQHEYYGLLRTARTGTSQQDRAVHALRRKFLTIQSNRGEHFCKITQAAFCGNAAIALSRPSTEEACQQSNAETPDDISAGLYKMALILQFKSLDLLDVRDDMPAAVAAALREMAQSIAAELEAMAMRVEQVPSDPFSMKPRGYAIRRADNGKLLAEHVTFEMATQLAGVYEQATRIKTEISRFPIEESYAMQRHLDGISRGVMIE
jgi:hypothetical protein